MSAYDPEKITFFAKTDARGQQVPFGIKAKDRQRHMYVIGKTGMGKSTLLENMAAQDIINGEGMAFIDPHGSAIEVLLEYIPKERLDDVVYFAPFDMENPIAFNIMEDVGVDTRHLVVSGLMSTFKKIWEDAWSARMEYILTNALLALIEYPDTTLLSVNRMLADKAYRDKVVAHIQDPAVKAYWVDEFASYTERFAAEALPAIQNKIGQFTGNPLIRNIIGQPHSSFDVRKMMDERKILLINLSKGLVGETNADLIGSMLITKIYLAAMSRAELPPAQMKLMPNFYFYVDEFQSFANSTFANILSEARKYHLNLIIAHQYVAQMEEKIRDAVFGNVGTTVAFRTGPFDAEVLETVFAPQFEAVDLVNLGMYQVCLTLMIDGVGSTPFSAVTLPPVQTPATSHKHMAIKRSQQQFSRPRAEVEKAVVDSHAPEKRIEEAVEKGGGNKGGFAKPSAYFKVGSEPGKGKPKPKNNNGNGNSNNDGAQNRNPDNQSRSQNDTRPQRQRPPEKTPDELRNILAQMTGKKLDPEEKDEVQLAAEADKKYEQAKQEKSKSAAQHKEQTADQQISSSNEGSSQSQSNSDESKPAFAQPDTKAEAATTTSETQPQSQTNQPADLKKNDTAPANKEQTTVTTTNQAEPAASESTKNEQTQQTEKKPLIVVVPPVPERSRRQESAAAPKPEVTQQSPAQTESSNPNVERRQNSERSDRSAPTRNQNQRPAAPVRQNPSRDARPAVAKNTNKSQSKSSEDLRQILKAMVQEKQEKKAADKEAELFAADRVKKPRIDHRPLKPVANDTKPDPKQDLKSALAAVLQKTNTETETRKPEVAQDQATTQPARVEPRPAPAVPDRSPTEQPTPARQFISFTPKSIQSQSTQVPAAPDQPQPTSTQTPAAPAEQSLSAPTAPGLLFKQSPEPAVGGVRQPAYVPQEEAPKQPAHIPQPEVPSQPAYVPHEVSNQPDLATAKKILRHSGKERPPGS